MKLCIVEYIRLASARAYALSVLFEVLGWTSAIAAYGAAIFPAILGSTEAKHIPMYLFAVSAHRVQTCK